MQISILTEFRNNIYIIFGHENINRMKDIFMTNSTQRCDLVIQKIFLDFVLDFGELDDLDGYGLQCVLIDSFENLRAKA